MYSLLYQLQMSLSVFYLIYSVWQKINKPADSAHDQPVVPPSGSLDFIFQVINVDSHMVSLNPTMPVDMSRRVSVFILYLETSYLYVDI